MLNILRRTMIITLLFVITGCKIQVGADLYARDVFAEENLSFPALLKFEVPSCNDESRLEYERGVLSVFSEQSNAKVGGCDEGWESFVVINFSGELATESSVYDFVFLRNINESGSISLKPALNSSFLSRVDALMQKDFQKLESENIQITFNIHNDESSDVGYFVNEAWVDGEPQQWFRNNLQRREKVEVVASNVISALVLDNKQPIVIELEK